MWRNKKGRIRRIWKIAGVVLLLLYFLPLLAHIIPFGLDQKEAKTYFQKYDVAFLDSSVIFNGQNVRFLATGPDTGIMVLLIHGSPGTWSDLKEYLVDTVLNRRFRVVAFDRPGYGESGGNGYARLEDQANAALAIIRARKNKAPVIVMGHSYGGPVALKLATLVPEHIAGLLLVSPTVAPTVEEGITEKRLLQNYSRFWAFRWMMADMLVHSTNEMKPLPDEVRIMEKDFAKINCPVIEFHGTRDWMAPFPNQAYICTGLVCTRVDTVSVKDGDHFLVWSMRPKVVELIIKLGNEGRLPEKLNRTKSDIDLFKQLTRGKLVQ